MVDLAGEFKEIEWDTIIMQQKDETLFYLEKDI